MGSSKSQVVGYWYRLLAHYGLCKGPVDAFLELRGGDRTAWKGLLKASGRIRVNAANLWGGKSSEGGLDGEMDLMFGEAGQQPNDYLAANLNAEQPGYRGRTTAVWRGGRYGAMNPYPKTLAFKVRRILAGWDNDTPWYPEKAVIPLLPATPMALYFSLDLSGSMGNISSNGQSRLANMRAAIIAVLQVILDTVLASGSVIDIMVVGWSTSYETRYTMLRRNCSRTDILQLQAFVGGLPASGLTYFPAGLQDAAGFFADAAADALPMLFFLTDGVPGGGDALPPPEEIAREAGALVSALQGVSVYAMNIDETDTTYTEYVDNTPDDGVPVLSGGDPDGLTNIILSAMGGLLGMNPAHIIYDALTAKDMKGEPVGLISAASFSAAADRFWTEGLGLCTTYDFSEDVDDFIQRICNVAGCSCTQSRVDGLYYLDLVRGDYDLDDLPVLTSDDIYEFAQEPSNLTETINQVSVEWYDPQTKSNRTTAPVRAMGAIKAAGGVIPSVSTYREIPIEGLALRVAARDVQAKATPLSRFSLTTNRRPWKWRPGTPFRLQMPEEGIADMVCMLGDIDTGTFESGRCQLKAVQDVFTFPDTVYVQPQPGVVVPSNPSPPASPYQALLECPYVELVTRLSNADLAAFPEDAGVLLTIAAPPSDGLNYSIYTAAEGEGLADYGSAEWCPTAKVIEEAGLLDVAFTLTEALDLHNVDVGTWALWDAEVARVDSLDVAAGTITLGRGCADTVPATHAAGSRIFFCADFVGSDGREYVDGETVTAKLLTRTASAEQPIAPAPQLTVEMAQRQFRPYPPAGVKVNNSYYPDSVVSPVGIVWNTRNRAIQADKLLEWTADSVMSEDGVTWDVEIRRDSDGSLVNSAAGLSSPSYTFSSSYNGVVNLMVRAKRDGLQAWQDFTHQFMLGVILPSTLPEVRSGISSFSSVASTTANVALPSDYEAGDYLLVSLELPINTAPTTPTGWGRLAIVFGSSDSSVATDSVLVLFGKVASGAEGSALAVTTTSATFGAVAMAIKKNTYTEPRGVAGVANSLGTLESGGACVGDSFYSASIIRHRPFATSWGGGKALWLSICGRKQASLDPATWPYPDHQYSVASDSTSVPDCRVCGEVLDTPPALPVTPANYPKSSYVSASTVNIAIRGVFTPERPECILMQSASSTSTASLSIGTPTGTQAPIAGDLQLLVVMMYGAGSVTITPPAGFTLVRKYGTKIAVYKRVITGGEAFPEAIGFSTAIAAMARIFTFPAGTYAEGGEVVSAGGSGSVAAAVTPAVSGDSTWADKRNYGLRFVVRDGAGGLNPVTSFPSNCLELRGWTFTQGSSGSQVSFASCGGVVDGADAPAETITMPSASAYESITVFVKGV